MTNLPKNKIKYTTLFPTSLIVNGLDKFGYELAKSLTEQGGYVIIVDNLDKENEPAEFAELKNTAFLDFTGVAEMVEEIRRLDYIFYMNHNAFSEESGFSSQEFLAASSYLNQILNLGVEFEVKFLLTNSIRAHKILLSATHLTDSFTKRPEKGYLAYSQSEFVRYAENLVLEYKNARGLDTKILRMGELLGEGVELDKLTNVGKMVWQAVNGDDLYLDEDGLSSEYYVHLVDAVYAVIKAQFSNLDEDGKQKSPDAIFTVAYDEPVTQLSLAYKIQEFEPTAGDIKFIDKENVEINLNAPIYKPAPSLSTVGWKANIDLNSALIQTLAFVKNNIEAESYLQSNSEVLGEEVIEDEDLSGPLARLIAERKRNDNLQKEKYKKGVKDMELKKRNVPASTKLRRSLLKRYDKFKQNFLFLKDITLLEAGVYAVLIIVFMVIFFTILAPAIAIGRDYFLLTRNLDQISIAESENNWDVVNSNADQAQSNLHSLNNTIENADALFTFSGRKDLQTELLAFVQSLTFFVDSKANLAESALGVNTFFGSTANELAYRPTNASVLSISEGANGSGSTTSIVEVKSKNEIGFKSLENSERVFSRLDRNKFPGIFQPSFNQMSDSVLKQRSLLEKNAKLVTIADNLNQADYTLGIIVQDSMRPTFSGGEIASVGYLNFSKGELNSVRLASINNVELKINSLSDLELEELKKASKGRIQSAGEINATEALKYAITSGTYDTLSAKALSTSFNRDIDDVATINLLALGELLAATGEVEVNGETLDSTNYLQQINILQRNSVRTRNEIITNLVALVSTSIYEDRKSNLDKIANTFATNYSQNFINFNENFLEALKVEDDSKDSDFQLAVLANNVESFSAVPSIDLDLETRFSGDKSTTTATVDTSNAIEIDNVAVCLPARARELDFLNTAIENYSEFTLDDKRCVVFDVSRVKSYKFDYQMTNPVSNIYSSNIAFTPGFEVRYDIETGFPISFELSESSPEANRNSNSIFYSGESFSGFKYTLKFKS